MTIKKYYSTVSDVIYNNLHYRTLYAVLLEMDSVGFSTRFHFVEHTLPILSVCNCIRTIIGELQSSLNIYECVQVYHDNLTPNPEFHNLDVEVVGTPSYEFCTVSAEQREAILILAYVLADHSLQLQQEQSIHFLRFLCEHHQDYSHLDLLEAAYFDRYDRISHNTNHANSLLENYIIATSCLHSIELTLQRKNQAQKQTILNNHIESFLLENSPLSDLISSMLIMRLRALDTEYDVIPGLDNQLAMLEQGTDVPGSLQCIASDDDASSKGATYNQQVLLFYYLFDELGINFSNSDKSAWARLIHFITGASEKNLRKYMSLEFEKKFVQKDLFVIKAALSELFPQIAKKVERDKDISI